MVLVIPFFLAMRVVLSKARRTRSSVKDRFVM